MPSVDSPIEEQNEEARISDRNFEFRRILNNAYAFVQGELNTQSFSAITYEELAAQQNERIEGKGTESRPTELERLDKIKQDMLSIVEAIKASDPNDFLIPNPDKDVNTPPETSTETLKKEQEQLQNG